MNRSRNENYRNQGDGWTSERARRPTQYSSQDYDRYRSRSEEEDYQNEEHSDFGRQNQFQGQGQYQRQGSRTEGRWPDRRPGFEQRYSDDDQNDFGEQDSYRYEGGLSRGQNYRGRVNSTYRQDYNSSDYGGYGNDFESSRYSRGEHFGKGPKGYKRSSKRILEEVNEALYRNGSVDASDIEVSMDAETVVLKGSVSSREAKREAERCVENLNGVEDVRNEIRIKKDSGFPRAASSQASQ